MVCPHVAHPPGAPWSATTGPGDGMTGGVLFSSARPAAGKAAHTLRTSTSAFLIAVSLETVTKPLPPPPPRSGEGEQKVFLPSPSRGGGRGEGLLNPSFRFARTSRSCFSLSAFHADRQKSETGSDRQHATVTDRRTGITRKVYNDGVCARKPRKARRLRGFPVP